MYQGRKLKANSKRPCHMENNLRKMGFTFFFPGSEFRDLLKGHFADEIKGAT